MEQKTSDSQPAKKPGHINWVVVGIVAAVVAALIFAGGTFAAGRLAAPGRGGEGGFGGQRANFQIQAAKELPTDTPTLSGVVTQRTGNSLSVGQRNGGFAPGGGNGTNETTTLVDVVITADTTIYHDTTQLNFNGQQPPGGAVQQTVEPGKVDSISTNSRVTVWGTQNSTQLTAKVLVYTDPLAFRAPQ
ncbi:MAG TPA: hypothetical protein VFF59_02835 [Anaerolineae bacterium]|nr:hypothetical protein [Anaerolineae bacterium]